MIRLSLPRLPFALNSGRVDRLRMLYEQAHYSVWHIGHCEQIYSDLRPRGSAGLLDVWLLEKLPCMDRKLSHERGLVQERLRRVDRRGRV